VIDDVDTALRRILADALEDEKATVAFDAPTPGWAAMQEGQVLDVFLYDVREDLDARSGDWVDVRNEQGRVVGRQPPVRHYRLSYLVSAWADRPEDEHRMLGRVLGTVPDQQVMAAGTLDGRLGDQNLPVPLRVAVDQAPLGSVELWSAVGSPPRASCHLVVVVPVRPPLVTALEAPAARLDLGVRKEAPGTIEPAAAQGAPKRRWPGSRVSEEAAGPEPHAAGR
jgi:hypothetical protein